MPRTDDLIPSHPAVTQYPEPRTPPHRIGEQVDDLDYALQRVGLGSLQWKRKSGAAITSDDPSAGDGTVRVEIASGVFKVGGEDIAIPATTLDGLLPSTSYTLYYDGDTGTVGIVDTATAAHDALGFNRIPIGAVVTVADGHAGAPGGGTAIEPV